MFLTKLKSYLPLRMLFATLGLMTNLVVIKVDEMFFNQSVPLAKIRISMLSEVKDLNSDLTGNLILNTTAYKPGNLTIEVTDTRFANEKKTIMLVAEPADINVNLNLKPAMALKATYLDAVQKPVTGLSFVLSKDGLIISQSITNSKGAVTIYVPVELVSIGANKYVFDMSDTKAKYARISEVVEIAAGINKVEKIFKLQPFNGRLLNVKMFDSEFGRNVAGVTAALTQGSLAVQATSDFAGNAIFNITTFKIGEPATLVVKDNIIQDFTTSMSLQEGQKDITLIPMMAIQLVLNDKDTKKALTGFTVSLVKNKLPINTTISNSKGQVFFLVPKDLVTIGINTFTADIADPTLAYTRVAIDFKATAPKHTQVIKLGKKLDPVTLVQMQFVFKNVGVADLSVIVSHTSGVKMTQVTDADGFILFPAARIPAGENVTVEVNKVKMNTVFKPGFNDVVMQLPDPGQLQMTVLLRNYQTKQAAVNETIQVVCGSYQPKMVTDKIGSIKIVATPENGLKVGDMCALTLVNSSTYKAETVTGFVPFGQATRTWPLMPLVPQKEMSLAVTVKTGKVCIPATVVIETPNKGSMSQSTTKCLATFVSLEKEAKLVVGQTYKYKVTAPGFKEIVGNYVLAQEKDTLLIVMERK